MTRSVGSYRVLELSRCFAKLDEKHRVEKLWTKLLCLTAPHGITNLLVESGGAGRRKSCCAGTSSTLLVTNALRRHSLSQNGFLDIINLSKGTLQRHATAVSEAFQCDSYDTRYDKDRKGNNSLQAEI